MDGAQSSVFLAADFGVSKQLTGIFEHKEEVLVLPALRQTHGDGEDDRLQCGHVTVVRL